MEDVVGGLGLKSLGGGGFLVPEKYEGYTKVQGRAVVLDFWWQEGKAIRRLSRVPNLGPSPSFYHGCQYYAKLVSS